MIAATNLPESLDAALTRPGRFDRTVHVPLPDIGGRREARRRRTLRVPTPLSASRLRCSHPPPPRSNFTTPPALRQQAVLPRPLHPPPLTAHPAPRVRPVSAQIIKHYLKDKPTDPAVSVDTLARGTTGFSGAELSNLINMAAIRAAVTGADRIDERLLDWARDRVLMGAERTSAVISEENKRLTAFHEGGHAIVALRTAGAMPLHKATITPRGSSLGMVTQLPDKDETSVSLRQMRARLDVCMGGRVAEELVFGPENVTSGARSDLQQATRLARHMARSAPGPAPRCIHPASLRLSPPRPTPHLAHPTPPPAFRCASAA